MKRILIELLYLYHLINDVLYNYRINRANSIISLFHGSNLERHAFLVDRIIFFITNCYPNNIIEKNNSMSNSLNRGLLKQIEKKNELDNKFK